MFRTRDFALLFSIIAFLVVAIGGTLIMRWSQGDDILEGEARQASPAGQFEPVDTTSATYTAEIAATDTLSRNDRLAEMKEKIASRELSSTPEPEVITEPEVSTTTTTSTASFAPATTTLVFTEQRCGNYQLYAGIWDTQSMQMAVNSSDREWYIPVERSPGPGSTSTEPGELVIDKETKLIVSNNPIQSNPSCIFSDVVGVAQDNSLIRNTEVGLYSVFGSETLVGYALDGFPIYGSATIETDECGGVLTAVGYRYYLSSDRNVILGCFSALPVTFLQ